MGEKRQPPRSTAKLSSEDLSRMARESTGDVVEGEQAAGPEDDWQDVDIAIGSQANVQPLYARTTTVSDPMTMALLAEVARSSRTVDFDPEKLHEELANAPHSDDEITKPEITHPHVKRRG